MKCQVENCGRFAAETLHFRAGATLHGSSTVSVCFYHYVLLMMLTLKPADPDRADVLRDGS